MSADDFVDAAAKDNISKLILLYEEDNFLIDRQVDILCNVKCAFTGVIVSLFNDMAGSRWIYCTNVGYGFE